jgi:hypothetical protein
VNSLIFDTEGRCLYSMNSAVTETDYPDAGKVLLVEENFNPNDIWYDFQMNRMTNKTAFEEVVINNQIQNLATGTVANVNGTTVVVDDGSLELDVAVSQILTVILSHVKHYTKQVEVYCEA